MGRLNIAIVGSGISGLSAAYFLHQHHNIHIFESESRLGGHTHTITLTDGPDAGTAIDTGFIVFNSQNYPLFTQFLKDLNVDTQNTDMSFGFHSQKTGFQYSSKLPFGLLAQPLNLFKPKWWRMVNDILRFNKTSLEQLPSLSIELTLGNYLNQLKVSNDFINSYLTPMASAIWSTSMAKMLEFPAKSFLQFMNNHGLLSVSNQPQWHTIKGGSQRYIDAFLKQFTGKVSTLEPVQSVSRYENHVELQTPKSNYSFDKVIIAVHADQVLKLLKDPSTAEKQLFKTWTYSPNTAILHSDVSAMPSKKRAWASWNYCEEKTGTPEHPASVTYAMNSLQKLSTAQPYFVSLNRQTPIASHQGIQALHYTHPLYTQASLATQEAIQTLNGDRHTFFCGAYLGYGFHEDGFRSGLEVAHGLGRGLNSTQKPPL